MVIHNTKKQKAEYEILRNTIFNAGANLMRQEGVKEIPLFDDSQEEEVDEQKIRQEREALFSEFSS